MNQILFDGKASFNEWGMYLSSYSFGDATPKTHYVDIPSGDGSIDLTESLADDTTYNDRIFTAKFTLVPPHKDWDRIVTKVNNFLNGRKRKIKTLKEPTYYFVGRCATNYEEDGPVAYLTVTATCEPWKYKNQETIYNLVLPSSGILSVNCKNSRKRVVPEITTNQVLTIIHKQKEYAIVSGSYRYTNIRLGEGDNELIIKGPANTPIKITYQEGDL